MCQTLCGAPCVSFLILAVTFCCSHHCYTLQMNELRQREIKGKQFAQDPRNWRIQDSVPDSLTPRLTLSTPQLHGLPTQSIANPEVLLEMARGLAHRWQTQGLWAESGPPPCFLLPGALFLPGGSTELLAPSEGVVTLLQS